MFSNFVLVLGFQSSVKDTPYFILGILESCGTQQTAGAAAATTPACLWPVMGCDWAKKTCAFFLDEWVSWTCAGE